MHPTLHDLIQLQYEARRFSFLSRQPARSLLSGRHSSRLRGRGLDFEELRDYRPGDDIRTMDWRATARLKKPHVRVYSEERERPVLLVVDLRTPMFFGSRRTTKAGAAVELAALAGWRSLAAGDRVGAILLGDHDLIEIRPRRNRATVMRICQEMIGLLDKLPSDAEGRRPLNDALRAAFRVAHHDHLILLATDYDGDDAQTQELATQLAAHNDVIAALIYDPLGIWLPQIPDVELSDGSSRLPIPEDRGFPERFRSTFEARLKTLRERLSALRIPIMPISAAEPVPNQVRDALGVASPAASARS